MRFNIFKVIMDDWNCYFERDRARKDELRDLVIANGFDWAVKEIVLKSNYPDYVRNLRYAVCEAEREIERREFEERYMGSSGGQ